MLWASAAAADLLMPPSAKLAAGTLQHHASRVVSRWVSFTAAAANLSGASKGRSDEFFPCLEYRYKDSGVHGFKWGDVNKINGITLQQSYLPLTKPLDKITEYVSIKLLFPALDTGGEDRNIIYFCT